MDEHSNSSSIMLLLVLHNAFHAIKIYYLKNYRIEILITLISW